MTVKYSRRPEVVLMRLKLLSALGLAHGLLAILICVPAYAHHGAASYDSKTFTTLKGTVTDFQFINPHTEIFFDVKDSSGKVQQWIAEGISSVSMARGGWTRSSLKPGDQITIVGNVSKNGSKTMRLSKVVLPNGKALTVERGEDYADQ
jgi:hypothetical protein